MLLFFTNEWVKALIIDRQMAWVYSDHSIKCCFSLCIFFCVEFSGKQHTAFSVIASYFVTCRNALWMLKKLQLGGMCFTHLYALSLTVTFLLMFWHNRTFCEDRYLPQDRIWRCDIQTWSSMHPRGFQSNVKLTRFLSVHALNSSDHPHPSHYIHNFIRNIRAAQFCSLRLTIP